MNRRMVLTAALVAASIAASPVFAKKVGEAERDLAGVTVGMANAVQTAEAALNGRAFEADVDHDRYGHVWEIDLLTNDKRIVKAYVSATTGKMVASEEKTSRHAQYPDIKVTRYGENGEPLTR